MSVVAVAGQGSVTQSRHGRDRRLRGGPVVDCWRLKEKLSCGARMSASGGREKQWGILVHTEDACTVVG